MKNVCSVKKTDTIINSNDAHWDFRNHLNKLQVSEDGTLFDPLSGRIFHCNRSAVYLWGKLMNTTATTEMLCSMISSEYGLLPTQARRELFEFAQQLRVMFPQTISAALPHSNH